MAPKGKDKKSKKNEEVLDFETGLERLQEIVERLEKQDLPLEQAVSLFEEGMKLSNHCAKLLQKAEERIKVLVKDQESGQIVEKELDDIEQDLTL